eukprot:TRINITY_DN17359_c0_g1_i3.p1 TRINITY_DN17359_c0_g1~~TRINITY_DN17359_c0_g1_i3.p1  ORF type:complete len:222 (-),score=50.74 TRINITY_DN17359_c0_g1_i3:3-668(-)
MSTKFTIKPYAATSQMNQTSAFETWEALDAAITQIHRQDSGQLSYEELYRKAYHMVLYKHGHVLYAKLKEKVTSYLKEVSHSLAGVDSSASLLTAIGQRWGDHKLAMGMIRDILMYMDRTYIVKEKLTPVYDTGLELWLEHVLHAAPIKEHSLAEALGCIDRERQNEDIDRASLRKFSQMYLSLIHISEPTRLLSISYAVFCLKKKKKIISLTRYRNFYVS